VTVLEDAVATRLGFGNMEGRFAPEWVAANTAVAVAAASKARELNLLSHIDANSTLVNSVNLLGTARDLLATIDQVVPVRADAERDLPPEWIERYGAASQGSASRCRRTLSARPTRRSRNPRARPDLLRASG
jgi:hypothetical protein